MRKSSIMQLRLSAEALGEARRPADLARLLGLTLHRLTQVAAQPAYSVFQVPKRDGSARLIEDPDPALKAVQRRLNELLQAVYYFEKPEAVFGFVLNPVDDPAPRHIVSHAERHIGCRRLINIDLEDFFHQVTETRVLAGLQTPPFVFDGECAALLTRLCTWKGRLPMGAPTSPVLSNLAFRDADLALTRLSRERSWLYTRYADDLTFSTRTDTMQPGDLAETAHYLESALGYRVHPEKRRFSGDGDLKTVTRLVVTGTDVILPDDFYAELGHTLDDLRSARKVQHKMGRRHTHWLVEYQQRVEGMLAFAGHVLGDADPRYTALLDRYHAATTERPEDFGAYTWLDFPYI